MSAVHPRWGWDYLPHFRDYTLIIRPWGWRSPSFLGPTPNVTLISFIRPQGRDHLPCWLCISVCGDEIIRSMHRMTKHSMPHLYLLTFIISLGAETIHPYISLRGVRRWGVGALSSTPPHHWLINHNMRPCSYTWCQPCVQDIGPASPNPFP